MFQWALSPGTGGRRRKKRDAQKILSGLALSGNCLYEAPRAGPGRKKLSRQRFDLGAGESSPVTVYGLEAGKPNFLYGVLSDADYAGATTVSTSVAADAVAGS
jgi:hypothetical protein